MFNVIGDTIEYDGHRVAAFLPGVWPTLRDRVQDDLLDLDLEGVNVTHAAEIKTLKDAHAAEIKTLKDAHDAHAAEIKTLKDAHETKVADLEKSLALARAEAELGRKALRALNTIDAPGAAGAHIAELLYRNAGLLQRNAGLTEELKTANEYAEMWRDKYTSASPQKEKSTRRRRSGN